MTDLQILQAVLQRLRGYSWNLISYDYINCEGPELRRIVKAKLFPNQKQLKTQRKKQQSKK